MNQIVQIDMAATATTAYEHFPEIRQRMQHQDSIANMMSVLMTFRLLQSR